MVLLNFVGSLGDWIADWPDTVEGSPEKQQPQSTVASQMDGNRNDQAKPPP
eukprot:SAG31_NODE_6675_length_1930_cov_2.353905_4_plen_50_part_01